MHEIAAKLASLSGLAALLLLGSCSQSSPGSIVSSSPEAVPSPPSPTLARTSTAIAFVSDRTGETELYRINLDGSGLIKLTLNSGIEQAHSWSPDGSQVVFSSNNEGQYDIV
ncbi:MAG: hypothetical protein MJA27_20750, partial [Pseudanabaenales cyanobacterium]|nr:hypothetical protein [Pseudanabaenales cyanobacterium]